MTHPARKKTFVDPKVQGALVRRLVLHWVMFFSVAAIVAFCLQLLANPFRPLDEQLREVWWTHGPFLLVMFVMLPVFIVDTIKLSHRFAGPIYRLRNVVRALSRGETFQPLKFREMDFWQGLAEDFNEMVGRLKSDSGSDSFDADEQPALSAK